MQPSGIPIDESYPLPESVECPWCRDSDTYLMSPFGGFLTVAHYYCRRCRTVFDWIKREGTEGPAQP